MAGIYIHIPFCKQACHYCNFHFSTALGRKKDFVQALLREIQLQKDYLAGSEVTSIYFGGGTPSLLSSYDLQSIDQAIREAFPISPSAEVTLEANPDDLTKEKLQQLRQIGINRLSIGVQSFFDEDLQILNRAHGSKDAFLSIERAQDLGFTNLSIDLIYAIPTLDNQRWKENIKIVHKKQIPHLSAYSLTVEPHTPLIHLIQKGKIPPVEESKSAEQFEILISLMETLDYIHYETSNFCQKGKFSCHNTSYWKNQPYLGLGPSAHSYNKISRQWNIAQNGKYIQALSKNTVPYEKEILSSQQKYNEYILTSLRTIWGCDLNWMRENFSAYIKPLEEGVQKFTKEEYIVLVEGKILLTKKGKFFADYITSELCLVD